MNYFHTIPKELLEIILFNLDDPLILFELYDFDGFKDILTDNIFWNKKIKQDFPEINNKFVPSHLLNNNSNIFAVISNYSILLRSYKSTKKIIETYFRLRTDYNISYLLNSINIFDVLFVKGDQKEKIFKGFILRKADDYESNIVIWGQYNKITLQVNIYNMFRSYIFGEYNISSEELFNILFHIHCNGAYPN